MNCVAAAQVAALEVLERTHEFLGGGGEIFASARGCTLVLVGVAELDELLNLFAWEGGSESGMIRRGGPVMLKRGGVEARFMRVSNWSAGLAGDAV